MKIRNGFVSNSSSSSFVLMGFETKRPKFEDEEAGDFREKLNNEGFEMLDGNCDGIREGKFIVGVLLDGEDDVSINDIINKLEKLKSRFQTKGQAKIYSGERMI